MPVVVFKGSPKGRILRDELPHFPNNMIYAMQHNAWMDETVMLLWVERVLRLWHDGVCYSSHTNDRCTSQDYARRLYRVVSTSWRWHQQALERTNPRFLGAMHGGKGHYWPNCKASYTSRHCELVFCCIHSGKHPNNHQCMASHWPLHLVCSDVQDEAAWMDGTSYRPTRTRKWW